jgi:cytochrome c peroxidase
VWFLLPLLFAAASIVRAGEPRLQPLPVLARVNPALAELGRHLFFEPRLSGDGSRSCASCHDPARGYADGQALSRGYQGTEYFRNAPGLLSVRLRPRLLWDGRGTHLVQVVDEMVTAPHFMNGNGGIIEQRIRQVPALLALWRRAFGTTAEPRAAQAYQAIAEFLATLDAGTTAVDAALRGESDALPPLARTGMALFIGKAGCVRCHYGPLASDGRLHRTGVPANPALRREPLRAITLLHWLAQHDVPDYMAQRDDPGAYVISKIREDRGRFLTPGLRALTHTGPYMHNGVFATLEQVVDFYDRGGGVGSELRPLNLTAQQRQALVAFLKALSAPLEPVAAPPAYDYGTVAGAGR